VLYVQARRVPLLTGAGIQMRAMPPVGVEVAQSNRATALPKTATQEAAMVAVVPEDPIADIATWINSLP
jgi:hypothetical protein